MKGKTIVVGIAGGIAAYKAAHLSSALTKAGASVHVIMTESATRFITPLTLQSLTRHRVVIDLFEEAEPESIAHIRLADAADLMIVAPATANVIAKAAAGIADDMLTTTLLATRAPVLFAPAMNVHMYEHAIVQENIERLKRRGYLFADPGEGPLACGYTGKGRLPEPEDIVDMARAILERPLDLAGFRILVTAGATYEAIDPVRFIGNRSSGKMGYAIAEAAAARGAEVTLVSGVSSAPSVAAQIDLISVESASQMYEAVMSRAAGYDVIVKAAAVADYRPAEYSMEKIKKGAESMNISLVRNPDILSAVGAMKRSDQVVVGFAAETEQVEEHATRKLLAKNADIIVANDVSQPDAGFEVDTNRVLLIRRDRAVQALPLMSKRAVADCLLDEVIRLRGERTNHASL